MRLFIDECLSPVLAQRLNDSGLHDALHPRDYGRLGDPDHVVLRRCLDRDPRMRLRDIGEARRPLLEEPSAVAPMAAEQPGIHLVLNWAEGLK